MRAWLTHSFAPRSAAFGGGVGALTWLIGVDPMQAALLGWCAHVLAYMALLYRRLWCAEPEVMRRRALALADGRRVVLLLSIAGAAISLMAVVWELALRAGDWPEMTLAVITVILSWAYVHALFVQDYAHHYWRAEEGVEFPGGDGTPEFSEFVYLALNVGIAFQVADTTTRSTSVRRLVSLHMVVAFFFNAIIVASTVNVVAGLGER
ncbi:MAG: DUF1345 domain-containing protein [Acetobacteraceae bacterium]|nr:DUF1345 domain-containing protein [Acetobacteraceae bacterium]